MEQLSRPHCLLTRSSEGYSIMKQYAPGRGWISVVRKNGTAEFGKAFAAHPTLDASVLNGPSVGVESIAAFFAAVHVFCHVPGESTLGQSNSCG